MNNNYQTLHQHSIQEPEQFWAEAAKDISWDKPWDKVLDDSKKPFYR